MRSNSFRSSAAGSVLKRVSSDGRIRRWTCRSHLRAPLSREGEGPAGKVGEAQSAAKAKATVCLGVIGPTSGQDAREDESSATGLRLVFVSCFCLRSLLS